MPRTIGRGLLVLALVAAGLVTAIVIVPRAGNAFGGADAIHDVSALPERIDICGRRWSKDASTAPHASLADIRARDGVDPVVADPGLFAGCPPGACTTVAEDRPCHTVVYVRVGEDAYLAYELVGGP